MSFCCASRRKGRAMPDQRPTTPDQEPDSQTRSSPPAVPESKPSGSNHGLMRVRVIGDGNENGSPGQGIVHENVVVDAEGLIMVYSKIPPEEVFRFGLPLGPGEVFEQAKEVQFTSPADRSITTTRSDGLCIYCQLLLLPDAPEFALHQPCMELMVRNWDTCFLCKLINTSIGRQYPQLREHDFLSAETCITVQSQRFDHYSRIVASCGDTLRPITKGAPIIWTTPKRLGQLKDRKIWEPYYTPNATPPRYRMNVLREWLNECRLSHSECEHTLPQINQRSPTRLIKIMNSTNRKKPLTVKLCEMNDEDVPYVAFSHCWGSTGPLRTTKDNLAKHKKRIPYNDLPLSFQDAVAKAFLLDFEYVWIDSLCIVQDDMHDWEVEAARMADIYSSATVTFANTASSDSSQGCHPTYANPFAIPLEQDVALIRYEDNHDLDGKSAALNTRGWAFQEAVLSKRMICFDKDQMFWKCSRSHESEDGLLVLHDPTFDPGDWNLRACLRKLNAEKTPSYLFWYKMMESYSGRKFKFEEDRLAALAGVASAFRGYVSDMALVGLWQEDLTNGLLWRAAEPANRAMAKGIVPSWSWLAVSGPVRWSLRLAQRSQENQLQLISLDLKWAGVEMTSALLKAEMTVRGRLKRARPVLHGLFTYLHESDHRASDATSEQARMSAEAILGYCNWDTPEAPASDVWCLEVCHGLQRQDAKNPRNYAHLVLILVETDRELNQFKRVGVGCIWRESYLHGELADTVHETFLGVDEETITII